jgi:hypothetical protein
MEQKSHGISQILGEDLFIEEYGHSEMLSWSKCGIPRRILEESSFWINYFNEDIYPEVHSKRLMIFFGKCFDLLRHL